MRYPPVPITPPYFAAIPDAQRPVWFYRIDHESHIEYCKACDEFVNASNARAVMDRVAAMDRQIDALTSGGSGHGDAVTLAKLKRQRDALGDVEGMEVASGSEVLDMAARAFGHALVSVETVESDGERVTSMYPHDHEDRVAMLRGMPPTAMAQLAMSIRAQVVNPEHLGKSEGRSA
ncbi:MAG: hypothetical protein ACPGWS_09040 [Solirubrobacterales bacterium]